MEDNLINVTGSEEYSPGSEVGYTANLHSRLATVGPDEQKMHCYICGSEKVAADHKIIGALGRYKVFFHLQCLKDA